MMMDVFFKHRSIRKYKTNSVSEELLIRILEAGIRASTTGNMQVYSIVITREEETKRKLWECHFKQDMVLEAPLVLTFCADFNRFNKWCKLREANPGYNNFLSFCTASIDALLAAQNVALAAEANGLGICYLGTTTYMAYKIIDVLHLPGDVVPVTTLVMGYPDEKPSLADRLPLHGIIHHEIYHDYTSQDIDRIYKEKESLPLTKELLEINKKKTLAQVFTDNRYTKKDNIHFSKQFLRTITDQGFMNHEE